MTFLRIVEYCVYKVICITIKPSAFRVICIITLAWLCDGDWARGALSMRWIPNPNTTRVDNL